MKDGLAIRIDADVAADENRAALVDRFLEFLSEENIQVVEFNTVGKRMGLERDKAVQRTGQPEEKCCFPSRSTIIASTPGRFFIRESPPCVPKTKRAVDRKSLAMADGAITLIL